jgi:hypothetical protein
MKNHYLESTYTTKNNIRLPARPMERRMALGVGVRSPIALEINFPFIGHDLHFHQVVYMQLQKHAFTRVCESIYLVLSIIQASADTPPSNSTQKLAWIPSPDDQSVASEIKKN